MPDQVIKTFYKNRLPHIAPIGAIFFITFRLADALPYHVFKRIKSEFETKIEKLKSEKPINYKELINKEKKKYFSKYDQSIDVKPFGNCYLKQPKIAEIVSQEIIEFDGVLYDLHAFCIMPNHVHMLIDTRLQLPEEDEENYLEFLENYVQLDKIMKKIKGSTARFANLELKRKGTFWQKDSYDHYIRNEKEWKNVVAYILNNPVKAGLVKNWESWAYSFCKYSI